MIRKIYKKITSFSVWHHIPGLSYMMQAIDHEIMKPPCEDDNSKSNDVGEI
jgi:hypothetical protein